MNANKLVYKGFFNKKDVFSVKTKYIRQMKLKAKGFCFEDAVSNMVGEVSSQLKNHKFTTMMLNTFSNSTTLLASQANLIGSVSKYFEYKGDSKSSKKNVFFEDLGFQCGIPSVTLDGTLQDWEDISRRVRTIKELKLGLGWWADELQPIVDNILESYKGKANIEFWGHILDAETLWGNGERTFISGWISKLFLYDRNGNKRESKTETDMLPRGVNKTPFILEETEQQLEIISGFLGMNYDESGISPYIGWYVRNKHFSHFEQLSKHAKITERNPNKCCVIT